MNFFSIELSKVVLVVAIVSQLLEPVTVAFADSRVKDLSAVEREKLIRESLFAADNPQHDTAFLNPSPASSEIPVAERVGPGYGHRGQASERGGQDGTGLPNNTPQGGNPQPEQSSFPQYGSQRGNMRRPQTTYSDQRQDQQQQQEGVAVNGNGVRVNTGNNNIDRTVESFINRNVRGAQNAVRSLWR
jgi:hypothetical protein